MESGGEDFGGGGVVPGVGRIQRGECLIPLHQYKNTIFNLVKDHTICTPPSPTHEKRKFPDMGKKSYVGSLFLDCEPETQLVSYIMLYHVFHSMCPAFSDASHTSDIIVFLYYYEESHIVVLNSRYLHFQIQVIH